MTSHPDEDLIPDLEYEFYRPAKIFWRRVLASLGLGVLAGLSLYLVVLGLLSPQPYERHIVAQVLTLAVVAGILWQVPTMRRSAERKTLRLELHGAWWLAAEDKDPEFRRYDELRVRRERDERGTYLLLDGPVSDLPLRSEELVVAEDPELGPETDVLQRIEELIAQGRNALARRPSVGLRAEAMERLDSAERRLAAILNGRSPSSLTSWALLMVASVLTATVCLLWILGSPDHIDQLFELGGLAREPITLGDLVRLAGLVLAVSGAWPMLVFALSFGQLGRRASLRWGWERFTVVALGAGLSGSLIALPWYADSLGLAGCWGALSGLGAAGLVWAWRVGKGGLDVIGGRGFLGLFLLLVILSMFLLKTGWWAELIGGTVFGSILAWCSAKPNRRLIHMPPGPGWRRAAVSLFVLYGLVCVVQSVVFFS